VFIRTSLRRGIVYDGVNPCLLPAAKLKVGTLVSPTSLPHLSLTSPALSPPPPTAPFQVGAAKYGINPMASYDDIVTAFVRKLEGTMGARPGDGDDSSSSSSSSSAAAGGVGGGGGGGGGADPVAIAQRVLELGEQGSYEDILNIATAPGDALIHAKSSVAVMRKVGHNSPISAPI
jgi:hypothetical protein